MSKSKKFDGDSNFIPDSKDWDFGQDGDWTIDMWIKWSKWTRFKFIINKWYHKLIIRNWYSILYKLGIVKGTYHEYLDVRSFRRKKLKHFIVLIFLMLGYMLLSYLTDKFLGNYFFNLNDIQEIFK